jgi:hypothetical protein
MRLWGLLLAVMLGIGGTATAFVGVAILALALVQTSDMAIAGHGAGADVLSMLVLAAGIVGAMVGGVAGAWLGWTLARPCTRDLADEGVSDSA